MHEAAASYFLENADEIVFIVNRNGMIDYGNRAARRGLEIEDFSDINICQVLPSVVEYSQETQDLKFLVETGNEVQEVMIYRGNQTCFPAMMNINNVKVGDQYVFMGYDATQKNFLEKSVVQLKDEMEVLVKTKSEFVANVTHELRTPVNGISGNAKVLQEMETDEKKLRLLDLIQQGCKNSHAIINNILDFSKLDAGKFTLENLEFDFRNMIDFIKANHSNKIIEKGLDFVVNISPDVPERIIGDELRIGQILNNFLSNACKFTSVGRITLQVLKTAQKDNKIELFFMVMDTGIGISKAEQDKLFQSFTQVDASISRKYGGTGLGLNISKQLAELMGGGVQLSSEPGNGSNFSFRIWVELPEGVSTEETENVDADEMFQKLQFLNQEENSEDIWKYGTPANLEELKKKLSKLILCIEMENWEKAEMFTETVRQLIEEAPKEIKTAGLRLKMAVQKENYEKAIQSFESLQNGLTGGDSNG